MLVAERFLHLPVLAITGQMVCKKKLKSTSSRMAAGRAEADGSEVRPSSTLSSSSPLCSS
eukprot:762785-Hanusia_phi.AAC.1